MNFIEANQILKKHTEGEKIFLQVSSSANVEPFLLYLRAAAALKKTILDISTLPFGTLGQALFSPKSNESKEILLIMPWDILPELDWRSGITSQIPDKFTLFKRANDLTQRIVKRGSPIFYLQTPIPPVFSKSSETRLLQKYLVGLMAEAKAFFLEENIFSLSNYLSSGLPFSGVCMGETAKQIIEEVTWTCNEQYKLLITDLDNVLWSGLAAEDGPEGILCRPEGKGYKHFLYQNLLGRLQKMGILIAAVSRNDIEVAKLPIQKGKTQLQEPDFVDILASYEPKSLHIKRLAKRLNLGLESFVFIDDNPIEIAEVSAALPNVTCLSFPLQDDSIPSFFENIVSLFERDHISTEDAQRTEMYRRRLEVVEHMSVEGEGGDLDSFLKELQMELIFYDRTKGENERAIQLINKTNQFNLNGIRVSEDEVATILKSGGRLFTVKLDDRTGTHGEILACLIDKDLIVRSFVLSCRVFQRRIEYAFINKLLVMMNRDIKLKYQPTEKNTPMREFLKDESFEHSSDFITLHKERCLKAHYQKTGLFKITEVGFD